jgi:hypothetical protein
MAHQWRKRSAPLLSVPLRENQWRNERAIRFPLTAHQWRNGAENICPERLISPLGGCTGTRRTEETKEKLNSFTSPPLSRDGFESTTGSAQMSQRIEVKQSELVASKHATCGANCAIQTNGQLDEFSGCAMDMQFRSELGSPPEIVARIAAMSDLLSSSLGTAPDGSATPLGELACKVAGEAAEELLSVDGTTTIDAQVFVTAVRAAFVGGVQAMSAADESATLFHLERTFQLMSKAIQTLESLTGLDAEALRIVNPMSKTH